MHVLHLPPRHLGRVTAFAAALALAFVMLVALFTSDISGGGSSTASGDAVASTAVSTVAGSIAATSFRAGPQAPPAWVRDPLAPPSLVR